MDRKVPETRPEISVAAAMLALMLLAGTAAASAQGAGPPPGVTPSPGATAPGPTPAPSAVPPPGVPPNPSAPESAPPPPPTAAELLSSSLPKDISSASYYELVSWCEELGLDDSGSRKDLQARLASHFSVKLPEAPTPGKRAVTVRSARQSEYFTQSESQEKYVLLRGDVVVEVRDATDGTLQVIKAASLTFNQTRRTISAVGDVTYTLTRGGQTDTFTGQSLDFNLDSSEAIFYDGSTRRVIKRTGRDVPFTFAGETITRVSNDTIILQKGAFTSSETPADPLYQIRAGTVWLLAPGEWAVQDAVLFVGRVPVLYLPAFFWPGDDFFFNPNIGYKQREGSFLQTTTYLLGRKPKEDTPFSFLQLTGSGDAGYALEPHGLFLRKMPGTIAPKSDGHTLKLMADIYSRLGIMAGLAGDFSPLGTFRASIARSRTIFYDSFNGSVHAVPPKCGRRVLELLVRVRPQPPAAVRARGLSQGKRQRVLADGRFSVFLRPYLPNRFLHAVRERNALRSVRPAERDSPDDSAAGDPFMGPDQPPGLHQDGELPDHPEPLDPEPEPQHDLAKHDKHLRRPQRSCPFILLPFEHHDSERVVRRLR